MFDDILMKLLSSSHFDSWHDADKQKEKKILTCVTIHTKFYKELFLTENEGLKMQIRNFLIPYQI